MVLLINWFITDQSSTGGHWEKLRENGAIGVNLDRGNLGNFNKIDIAKYTLSSLAKYYPWKRAIIKIQLDEKYNSEKDKYELEEYIKKEFNEVDLYFSNKRNLIQQDWIDTYPLINDDLLYLCSNHDHVILDSDPEYLGKIINSINKEYNNEYISLCISHWSEMVRSAKCGYMDHHEYTVSSLRKDYELKDNYIVYEGTAHDAIYIISKSLYKNWFFQGEWDKLMPLFKDIFSSGHVELPRIDGVGIVDLNMIRNKFLNIPFPKQKIIIPYKEISRHFDGYFHQGITNDQSPSLDIPPGFFENDMKIRYGYNDRKEGWININPISEHYYAFDKSGTDYKFTLTELPVFWKDKITEIDINPEIDEEEMIQYRLKAILETVYSSAHVYPHKYHQYIDQQLVDNILNQYISQYPNYQIK
jgi:hypothetical protein